MNRTNILKNSLEALFRSGADQEHTADEMVELLEGIDFHALLQAIHSMRETVYEYSVTSHVEKGFEYRGPELFPGKAVLLYTDDSYGYYSAIVHEHAYELWLLPDATFVVVSRIRSVIGNDASVMEYRTIKGVNWMDAGMSIDFLELADDLEAICAAVTEHDLPLYEL